MMSIHNFHLYRPSLTLANKPLEPEDIIASNDEKSDANNDSSSAKFFQKPVNGFKIQVI